MKPGLWLSLFYIARGRTERVQVGPWQFGGQGAGEVLMYPYGTEFKDKYQSPIPCRDPGFEFAATSARDVNEVDATDRRLKWFRYVELPDRVDGSRVCMSQGISLAVSGLPK